MNKIQDTISKLLLFVCMVVLGFVPSLSLATVTGISCVALVLLAFNIFKITHLMLLRISHVHCDEENLLEIAAG